MQKVVKEEKVITFILCISCEQHLLKSQRCEHKILICEHRIEMNAMISSRGQGRGGLQSPAGTEGRVGVRGGGKTDATLLRAWWTTHGQTPQVHLKPESQKACYKHGNPASIITGINRRCLKKSSHKNSNINISLETWKAPPEKPRHDSQRLLGTQEEGKKWRVNYAFSL